MKINLQPRILTFYIDGYKIRRTLVFETAIRVSYSEMLRLQSDKSMYFLFDYENSNMLYEWAIKQLREETWKLMPYED